MTPEKRLHRPEKEPQYLEDYVRIAENLKNANGIVRTEATDVIVGVPQKPRIFFDNRGEITELHISQSLIKRVLYKEEAIPVCPSQLFHIELIRDIIGPKSKSMMYGLYFESQLLGKSARGEIVLDLPRNKRTGEKMVDQQRIDEAIDIFRQKAVPELGLIILPKFVQVESKKTWFPKKKGLFDWMKIYIEGTADLLTPFTYHEFTFPVVCADVKLTADRDNCYIDKDEPWNSFHWGCPEDMDLLQANMYDALFEIPFVFIVSDYRKEHMGYKPIPVKTLHSYPNDKVAVERHLSLHRSIEWTVQKIIQWNEEKWPKDPGPQCKRCPIHSCKFKNKQSPL